MPNKSQANQTTELLTLRNDYYRLQDKAELLVGTLVGLIETGSIPCSCAKVGGHVTVRQATCPQHAIWPVLAPLVRPGSPAAVSANHWLKGDLSYAE